MLGGRQMQRQKQIPFGNDNKEQIPFGNNNKK